MARLEHVAQTFGVQSGRQAAAFGVTCSLWGALAASIAWLAYEGTRPAPRTAGAAMCPTTLTAGTPETDTCCAPAFVPMHQRPDYIVESPDVLMVEAGDATTDGEKYPFSGPKLVHPDGHIQLDEFGTLLAAGKTVAEIEKALEAKLHERSAHACAKVSVLTNNSKVYYVIVEGGKEGDNVSRFPMVGNETVLDALTQINNVFEDWERKRIWIARPTAGGAGVDTVLPVSWNWLSEHGAEGENHSLLPGDRIFVTNVPDWISFIGRAAKAASEHAETAKKFPVQPAAAFTR